MRRPPILWSFGMIGSILSAGCALDTCSLCGRSGARNSNSHVLSRLDRPAVRTTQMPARQPHVAAGEDIVVIGEEPPKASPDASAPAPKTPLSVPDSNLPPVRLPFESRKAPAETVPLGDSGFLPPIVDRPNGTDAGSPIVRSGMNIPGSPDIPAVDRATPTKVAPPSFASTPTGEGLVELTNTSVRLGAGENHKSLTGHVASFRKTWRLRYAAVENEDLYGGSVMLSGAGLERLRDGQLVRVQGNIVAPADRNQPAVFQIQAVEILAPGN